jgi:hypothetical protein
VRHRDRRCHPATPQWLGQLARDEDVTTGRRAGLIAIVGGALVVIGCLLPWGHFASFLNVYSMSGISLDYGVITAVAGAVVVVCGVRTLQGYDRAAQLAAVPAAIALLAAGWVAISWQFGFGMPEGPGWTILNSLGLGLVVVAIGAVMVVGSSLWAIAARSRRAGS